MHILYLSQYYPPEMGAPAARVSELARHWVSAGHRVTVLTGFPNHPDGVVPPEWRTRLKRLWWREQEDGADVVRTWLYPAANRGALKRMANYASFCLSAVVRGVVLERPDVVIATSPQLLVGVAGAVLAKLKRCPWVFEVRDLWPESLVAVGAATEKSTIYRVLQRTARWLYADASHIVVVSPAFVGCLREPQWNVAGERISVITNGVEIDLFTPEGASQDPAVPQDAAGKFVVSYIGTVGMAHGVGTLLDCAERMRRRTDLLFLVVGEGAERSSLETLAAERRLANVRFIGPVGRERVPAILRASSACVVLLKNSDVFRTVIPTKMLEMMASGRPVIVGVEGQAAAIVKQANGGICVEPENDIQLADAVDLLSKSPELCARLGENGRRHIANEMSRQATAMEYLNVLARISEWQGIAGVPEDRNHGKMPGALESETSAAD